MSSAAEPEFRLQIIEYMRHRLHRFNELARMQVELVDMAIDQYTANEGFAPIMESREVQPGLQIVACPRLRVYGREISPLIVFDVLPNRELMLVLYVVDEIPITNEEKAEFDEIKEILWSFLEGLVGGVTAELVSNAVSRAILR